MRIVKTFESFYASDEDHEMMPHRAPNPDLMKQQPAGIDHESQHGTENYMFFGNLETIQRLSEMLLKMDPVKVDEVLKSGHSWAVDHVATSKDDIEEVANFLINEMTEVSEKSEETKEHEEDEKQTEKKEYVANEGMYTCNECGISYESSIVNEGDVCECGGTLNKE